MTDIL
jgi:sentrin-specific protease 1